MTDISHPTSPFTLDPWLASSLLQKAIRRGDVEAAQHAARVFFRRRGASLWRRFLVIAFEDIGVGSIETLVLTARMCGDPGWRVGIGSNEQIAALLARELAQAAKDRSSDYLLSSVIRHPWLDKVCDLLSSATVGEQLAFVGDEQVLLPIRAVGACYASGITRVAHEKVHGEALRPLLAAYAELDVPDELMEATRLAATLTREPITVLVPLIWTAAKAGVPVPVAVPHAPSCPLPLYALDKHTRLGRLAISRFSHENKSVRTCLDEFVPQQTRNEAAWMAAYYADAVQTSLKLDWPGSTEIEELGRVSDMLKAGVPRDGIGPLIEAVSSNLDHLNRIRAHYLSGRAWR